MKFRSTAIFTVVEIVLAVEVIIGLRVSEPRVGADVGNAGAAVGAAVGATVGAAGE